MLETLIDIESFLEIRHTSVIIDVRAPIEYNNGHIPGSINIPLFSDEERKVVGTKYTKVGRMQAVIAGLDYVGPKMSSFIKDLNSISKDKKVLVYCWRGGMRSEAMCFILKTAGFKVFRLKHGYKAYRNYIHQSFEESVKLIVLGGMTGSGKTVILQEIRNLGYQVLDLEDLANHKGSAFGKVGQLPQPTNEQFENNMYEIWKRFDFNLPVWIEDESMDIGKVKIPYLIYQAIRNASVINLKIEREARAARLVEEYSGNDEELKDAFERIKKRIGGLNLKNAIKAIDEKDYITAVMIALHYYDKTYEYGISKRAVSTVFNVQLESENNAENAKQIIKVAKNSLPHLF
ncbi:tRNA 2-selenouridine(34) synthase MnmH [Bacteroidota bacterium]